MDKIEIIKFDFSKAGQIMQIQKLCKNENFHEDDISLFFHQIKLPNQESIKNMITEKQLCETYFNQLKTVIEENKLAYNKWGYIAVEKYQIVGFILVETHKKTNWNYIQYILVDKLNRANGLGKKLMKIAIHECNNNPIIVQAEPSSISFFKKMNFKIFERDEHGFTIMGLNTYEPTDDEFVDCLREYLNTEY